jgi:predicted ester cyclase
MENDLDVVRDFYAGDFARGDGSRVKQVFTDDFLDHDPPRPGWPAGPRGVLAVMEMLSAAMPQRSVTVHDLFGAGDRVAIRFSIEGIQAGPFMGQPPTGARLVLDVIAILRVAGGRIAERWGRVQARGADFV